MNFYERVPKDMAGNLRWRREVMAKSRSDERYQEAFVEACRKEVLLWINSCVFTYDPRTALKTVPFITYGFQDQAVLAVMGAVRDQVPIVLEKVRDLGFSWLCLCVFAHQAMFEPWCKFLLMSRKKDLVDKKGDMDALFQRLDFVHRYLPPWMLNGGEVIRRDMVCEYVKTGSVMTGATTTEDAAVGGRATAILVDEYSRFDANEAKMIRSGLADVARCRVFNFTPNPKMGKSHPSYELVQQVKKGELRGVRAHWRDHPVKRKGLYRVDPKTRNVEVFDGGFDYTGYKFQLDGRFEWHSEWFDNERRERGNDNEVAEMLELEWKGSGMGVFDPLMIQGYALELVRPAVVEGDLVYDDDLGEPKGFVVQAGGPIKLWANLDARGKMEAAPYGAGIDASLGAGASNSCLSAGRLDTGEKILELASAVMRPDEFARRVVAICRWLSNPRWTCKMCWEKGGPGETFGTQVLKLGYSNVFFHQDTLAFRASVSKSPGWNPQKNGMLLDWYRSALSKREFANHSALALEECLEFVYTDAGIAHKANLNRKIDPSGATKNHGDRVIADAILWVLMKEYGGGRTAQEVKEKQKPGTMDWIMRFEDEAPVDVLYPSSGNV